MDVLKKYTTKEAIELLKQGKKVRLKSWKNKNYFHIDEYGYVSNRQGNRCYINIEEFSEFCLEFSWVEYLELEDEFSEYVEYT